MSDRDDIFWPFAASVFVAAGELLMIADA